MDRHPGRDAARRGRYRPGRPMGAVRGRRRLGSRALHPDREGDGRYAAGLWPERRAAATRARLSVAGPDPGLGRKRLGQVAAPHQGVGSALEPAQRDCALHRSDAGRQMAAVQLRHGMQVGRHPAIGGNEARRPRHLSDRRVRVVGQRHHQGGRHHARRRQDLARGHARGADPRSLSDPLPLRVAVGRRPREDRPVAPSTAPATCSRRSPRLPRRAPCPGSCSITTGFSRGRSMRQGR